MTPFTLAVATPVVARVYRTLIEGAGPGSSSRLDAFDPLDRQVADGLGHYRAEVNGQTEGR